MLLEIGEDFEQEPNGDRRSEVDRKSSVQNRPSSSVAKLFFVISPNKKSGSSAALKTSGNDGCLPKIGGDGEFVSQGRVVTFRAMSQFSKLSSVFIVGLVFLWTHVLSWLASRSFWQTFISDPRRALVAAILSSVSRLPQFDEASFSRKMDETSFN